MRDNLIYRYIKSLLNLYGVIELKKVIEIYNEQNEDKINEDNVNYLLEHIEHRIKQDKFKREFYVVDETYYVHEAAYNDDSYKYFKNVDKKIPYYVPSKEVLLKYYDNFYYEVTKEFNELNKYIKNNFEVNEEQANLKSEEIKLICKYNMTSQLSKEHLEKLGLTFTDNKQLQELLKYIFNLDYNTRKWKLKGHTPQEIDDNINER